jgi:hypothetical protein
MPVEPCEFDYPGFEIARPAAMNVLAKLRGDDSIDLACAVHCGWVVAGFAASFIPHDHPDPVPVFGSDALAVAGEAELQKLVAAQSAGAVAAVGAINWILIATYVLDLVQQWLRNRN